MGREPLQHPALTAALEKASVCVESLGAHFSPQEELHASEIALRISDADVSQAASTAIQIALVDLLRSWRIEPMAGVGHHSVKVAAVYAAYILSLPGAMRISSARSWMAIRVKQVEPNFKGGMMAVGAGLEDVALLLDIVTCGPVVIACEYSPRSIAVSGEDMALAELESLLEEDGMPQRRLALLLEVLLYQVSEYVSRAATEPESSCSGSETDPNANLFAFVELSIGPVHQLPVIDTSKSGVVTADPEC